MSVAAKDGRFWLMLTPIKLIGFLTIVGSIFLGCDTTAPVVDQLNSGLDKVLQNGEQVSKATSDEIEKLFSVEYKVVELTQIDAAEIELKLATLGRDRWECFFIEPVNGAKRFYFKRSPKTLLRYIPRMFY